MDPALARCRQIGLQTWERAERWRKALENIQGKTTDPTILAIIGDAFLSTSTKKDY